MVKLKTMESQIRPNPKELAASRTKILIINSQPPTVFSLAQYLKVNGKFNSVDIFAVNQQSNNDTHLEGGYEQLKIKVDESLQSGENLIILSDYSFDKSGYKHSEENGLTWTRRLIDDFEEQKNNKQFTIYGHTDAHLNDPSIEELFVDFGARGMIPKKNDPQTVLSILESETVIGRIKHLLNIENPEVIKLLTNDVVNQIIPSDDPRSSLVRHNLNNILGYATFTGSPIKREINLKEIKQIMSMLDDFSGTLDLEGGSYLSDVVGSSFIFDKGFMKFSNEGVQLDRYLNPLIVNFLSNLTSVFESNIWDILKENLRRDGFVELNQFIVPFIFVEGGNLIVAFANNGPTMDENIFNNLGKKGITTKGENRGTGLASAAQIAQEMGIGISIMQIGRGRANCHNIVTQANFSADYFDSFEDTALEKVKLTLLNDLSEFQQAHFNKFNYGFGLSFIVSIPLEKVYKK